MISIIVPVYNTVKYLPQCVRSITAQDYRDIEIILVNDASTDDSIEVCRRLAAQDSRVKVIDKTVNQGVDFARFTGLDNMSETSEYVMFVDSDDWLNPGIISRCVSVAEDSGADIVQTGLQRVYDRWGLLTRKTRFNIGKNTDNGYRIITEGLFEDYFISYFGVNIVPVNLYAKLYKRSVLERSEIKPTGLRWGEDLIMNMHMFPYLDSMAIIDDIGYNYRVGGMTSHYLPWLIPASVEMFGLKEQAIERFKYDKATYPTRVEMKNILRSDICQRIAWRVGTAESNIRDIGAILVDPLWDRVGELAQDSRHTNDAFVQALGRKDAKALYEVCASFTKSYGLKRKLQETILKIIS